MSRVTRYSVAGEFDARIALACDLHGRDPEWCLAALRAEKPDLIAAAGDLFETERPAGAPSSDGIARIWALHAASRLLNSVALRRRDGTGRENALRFLRAAAGIAPTYYAPGNHDAWLTREDRREIAREGVTIIENSSADFRRGDDRIAIGGLCSQTASGWLRAFSRKRGAKILICHRPELYEQMVRALDIPLTLSGHAHGGQWRVFGRGVYAPGQGLFPKYVRGVYDGRLVVSAGLANTAHVPRFGNPTELVILDIKRTP